MYCPPSYNYLHNHLWFQSVGKQDILVGVTDFIQIEIGRMELIELEREGSVVEKDKLFAKLFGNNTLFNLPMPVTGKLLAINHSIIENPALINIDPYHNWIVIISSDAILDMSSINYLNAEDYKNLIRTGALSLKQEQFFSTWINKN